MERQHSLHRSKPRRIHTAHLSGSHAHRLAVARIDNRVRLDVFAYAPGKDQAAKFLGSGRAPGDYLQLRLVHPLGIGVLEEKAAGDVFDHGAGRRRLDFDEAQILFGGEALAGFFCE